MLTFMGVFFPFSFLFVCTLFLGSFFAVSSSHWLGMWVGLELNLMSFLPLVVYVGGFQEVEGAVKYFLVQAFGSGLFLLGGFYSYYVSGFWSLSFLFGFSWFFSFLGLCVKLGLFPFHFWIPSVMGGMSWFGCAILASWQKLAPFFLLVWLLSDVLFDFVLFCGLFSSVVGGLGGINQSHLRLLMSYSSINHLGWMCVASLYSFCCGFIYYFVYFLISVSIFFWLSFFNFVRLGSGVVFSFSFFFFVFFLILSLGGIPPFFGFLSKWVVIQELVSSGSFFVLVVLILGSLLSLFFYLGLFFSLFLISFRLSYVSFFQFNFVWHFFLYFFFSLSVFGLPLFSFIFSFF